MSLHHIEISQLSQISTFYLLLHPTTMLALPHLCKSTFLKLKLPLARDPLALIAGATLPANVRGPADFKDLSM